MTLYQKLQNQITNTNMDNVYKIICKNIKKYRLEKYYEFKANNYNDKINPYSTENISALLNYNHNHYKRFESENDSTKRIPLEKIVYLSIILEKDINDFFKD